MLTKMEQQIMALHKVVMLTVMLTRLFLTHLRQIKYTEILKQSCLVHFS